MRFYKATLFLFPRDLRMRIFAVCFAGTHVPLLSFIAWGAWSGSFDFAELGLVLAATLAGTGFTLFSINGLLAPVREATAAIAALERDQSAALATVRSSDMLGELIASIDRASEATRSRIAVLDSAAHRDALTGLWNRRGFMTQSSTISAGALALIDIDRFKRINDRAGHAAGDEVLRSFAARLEQALRRDDIVARWGGEEFVALFPGAAEDEAAAVLARLRAAFAQDPLTAGDGVPVTFSAGVVELDAAPLEDSVIRADAALYAAKDQGRNRIETGTRERQATAR